MPIMQRMLFAAEIASDGRMAAARVSRGPDRPGVPCFEMTVPGLAIICVYMPRGLPRSDQDRVQIEQRIAEQVRRMCGLDD